MDNKIPDGQLRKVLDPLTVIVFLFFTRLLLFAENISFCNNRKLYKRILEAFSGMAVNHHDLSGIEDTLAVLSIKRRSAPDPEDPLPDALPLSGSLT